jgi:uncharacterized protein DUF6086
VAGGRRAGADGNTRCSLALKIADNGFMSRYFQVGDQVLWNPSNGVAELFVSTANALASAVGVPTGIGLMEADEYQLDLDAFGAFVDALVGRYVASRHPILRSLLEGFTATALVIVKRGGRGVPALDESASTGLHDVSVGPTSMAAPGDAGRLRRLSEEHDRAMPY